VQRRRQARFPDDVRGAPWPLVVEELGGRQGGGPDQRLWYVDPAPQQSRAQISRREDRVVGEDEIPPPQLLQAREEGRCTGDGQVLADEHAVHVGQPAVDRLALAHPSILLARSEHIG
jgi:hypothetical protein